MRIASLRVLSFFVLLWMRDEFFRSTVCHIVGMFDILCIFDILIVVQFKHFVILHFFYYGLQFYKFEHFNILSF